MSERSDILKVTTIQTILFWEDRAANLAHFETLINGVGETDVIILPEMFTTGFSMQSTAMAEVANGPVVDWMKDLSAAKNAVLMGSMMTGENGKFYNRLYVTLPNGTVYQYDKRHLFSLAGEDKHYTQGSSKLIFEYKGWRVCPLVCYDLRFPVFSRNRKTEAGFDYDLLIYVANWPERRSHAWNSLLPARAIENQSYTVGVNRIGDDGTGIHYSGDTAVFDYKGDKLSTTQPERETVETIELNYHDMEVFRRAYAFLSDADEFAMKV